MLELSPAAQTWLQVILIWIGFGSLAGLLARVFLPFRDPASSLATMTLGITGTAIGLGALSWIQNGRPTNPISPIGFLAAVGGALGLLVAYHVLRLTVYRPQSPAKKPAAEEPTSPQSTNSASGY